MKLSYPKQGTTPQVLGKDSKIQDFGPKHFAILSFCAMLSLNVRAPVLCLFILTSV